MLLLGPEQQKEEDQGGRQQRASGKESFHKETPPETGIDFLQQSACWLGGPAYHITVRQQASRRLAGWNR